MRILPASSDLSTTHLHLQMHLETAAKEAAANAGKLARARLKQQQRESATEYGRALFQAHGEKVALGLERILGRAINREQVAGPHFAGLLDLMKLCDKGPKPIAAIALGVVLDKVSQRTGYRALANAIGRAIEEEVRVLPVEDRGADLLRIARRRHGRQLASAQRLKELRIEHQPWETKQRYEVGALLLELVLAETQLLRVETAAGRKGKQLVPNPVVAEIIAAHPPTPHRVRRLPMLVPPRPWQGMKGGGHLDNDEPLVRSRQGLSLAYLDGHLGGALRVANALQGQQLQIDRWMVTQQRIAWDASLRGLFPLLRDPLEPPPKPQELVGAEEFKAWQRQVQRAARDRALGRPVRERVEQGIRQCEQVAGLPCWFAYNLDFRGRLYTSNRYATHQGPDWEKAAITVANALPCDERSIDWVLQAAAGHWGERGSWPQRLAWGRERVEWMVAAAEEPLDRLHLWRDAKEPWQFLSCCRALHLWLQDPSEPVHQLIRFDQTTSGPGIVAALTRDRAIARATNLIGSTRHDLYVEVAEEVSRLLRADLEAGDAREQRLAGFWLERGISRSMAKGPVMTTIYGAQMLGIAEQLVALLDEQEGEVSLGRLERERLVPCRYLSRKFGLVLGAKLKPALELQSWLRSASRRSLSKNIPMAWTSPMGLPIQVGRPMGSTSRINTLLSGRRRWRTLLDQPRDGELSARETSRGVMANVVHSFDAALAWAVVCIGADKGVAVLPNHDCFAVAPCHAEWLHATLHQQLRELYKPDWLAEIGAEIAATARLSRLAAAPMVGTLEVGEIGQNPYCFS